MPDNKLRLRPASASTKRFADLPAWKILVVDDEEEVHRVTRLVLAGLHFRGAELELVDAYSGEEAVNLMREHPDIAVILLDIVMETETAGWHAVTRIREELGNRDVQIIIRTGFAGTVEEQDMIARHAINDYRGKGELTRERMFVAICSALNAFHSTRILRSTQQTIASLSTFSAQLRFCPSLAELMHNQLTEFCEAMQIRHALVALESGPADQVTGRCELAPYLAGIGRYAELDASQPHWGLPAELHGRLTQACNEDGQSQDNDAEVLLSCRSDGGRRILLFARSGGLERNREARAARWFASSLGADVEIQINARIISDSLDQLITLLSQNDAPVLIS